MQQIVGSEGRVTTVEIDMEIARQAERNLFRAKSTSVLVINDDGAKGYAPRAAYDRIICTAAVWDIPPTWVRQLKPNGLLVTPILLDGLQVSTAFRLGADGTLVSEQNLPCWFVYLRGISEGPQVMKRVGTTGLSLIGDHIGDIDSAALHTLFGVDHEVCHLSQPLESREMYYGFMPYVMLHEPSADVFALFSVMEKQKAYGLEGRGFCLITPGGASLVPFDGLGEAHCFSGVDAFMDLESLLTAWMDAGKPTLDQLRLRLIPQAVEAPLVERGKVYHRRHHHLAAWLEG